jgi:hypothetical protein
VPHFLLAEARQPMRIVPLLFLVFYFTHGLISSFAFASGTCAVRCDADSTKAPCDEACAASGCCKVLSVLPSQARTQNVTELMRSAPAAPDTSPVSLSANDILHVPKPQRV